MIEILLDNLLKLPNSIIEFLILIMPILYPLPQILDHFLKTIEAYIILKIFLYLLTSLTSPIFILQCGLRDSNLLLYFFLEILFENEIDDI